MIIDELNKKIADIESRTNDKTSTIESKVSDLTDGLLMVVDTVDNIPVVVDEKIDAIKKEFISIKDTISKVQLRKGDAGKDGKDGRDGKNGREGKDGRDGRDGIDGLDGSSDSGKEIVVKLNTLENAMDWKVLKNFDSLVNQDTLKKAVQTLENQTRYLLQSTRSNGGSGTPSAPSNSIQYNNAGAFYGDALATRDPVTNYTDISRDFDSNQTEYTADISATFLVSSISGTFTVGEVIDNLTTGATGILRFVGNPGGDLFYISDITGGTFNSLDNLQGQTSLETCTITTDFPSSFTVGQTIIFLDTIGSVFTGAGTITGITGSVYTFVVQFGTVSNFDVISDGSSNGVGIYTLSSSVVTIPMTTGFKTDDNFAGLGLKGTYMHIEDTTTDGIMDFGVFDLTGFGGTRTTAGIVSIDLPSGAATTFVVNPAGSNGGINMSDQNASGDNIALQMANGSFSWLTSLSGGDEYGISSSGSNLLFRTSSNNYVWPDTEPNVNDVLYVTNGSSGNWNLGWTTGGGGGSSSSPQYSVQMSDGSGGFVSTGSFIYNTNLNYIQVTPVNGLYVNGSENLNSNQFYYFGNFVNDGNQTNFYIDTQNGSNQMFYVNSTHSLTTPVFTGTGTDDLTPNGGQNINLSYTVTIDSPNVYGGTMHTVVGLNDGLFSGYTTSTTTNYKVDVIIDSVGGTDTFEWFIDGVSQASGVAITGAGQLLFDSLTITFAATTGHTLGDKWNTVSGNGYIQYSTTSESGTMTIGDTVTGSVSGATAVVSYAEQSSYHVIDLHSMSAGFVQGETLTATSNSATVVITGFSTQGIGDSFEWTDGTNTQSRVPVSTTATFQSNNSVYFSWGSATGHDLGDFWTFDIVTISRRKFQILPNSIQIGDVEGAFNYDRLLIDVQNGANVMGSSASFSFHNTYPLQGDRPLLTINTATENTVVIGDKNNSFNGFYSEMDMVNGLYQVGGGGASGFKLFKVDFPNNYYSLGNADNGDISLVLDGNTGAATIDTLGGVFTAGDVNNNVNGTKMDIDDTAQAISFVANGDTKYSSDIPKSIVVGVSSAEILAINTTPKELIPAPGVGKVIQIISIMTNYTYGTTTYVGTTTLDYVYGAGAPLYSDGVLANTGSVITYPLLTLTPYATINSAFNLTAGANPTTGDGTVDIYITYKIVTL